MRKLVFEEDAQRDIQSHLMSEPKLVKRFLI